VKSDLSFGRNRGLQHLPEGGKNGVKFGVAPLLHFGDLAAQVFVSGEHGAELQKGTHDGDVNLHGAITVKNAGEHGYAVFGESMWKIAAATAALFFDIPDWNIKESRSDEVTRNMKSFGNLRKFLATALFKLKVVTP
jgi:hypothetical protein